MMTEQNTISHIASIFDISEKTSWVLKAASICGPINQRKLQQELNHQGVSISRGWVSESCDLLVQRKLLKLFESGKNHFYTIDEKTSELLRKYIRSLEFASIENLIDKIPSHLQSSPEIKNDDAFLKNENDLYNRGRWGAAREKLRGYERRDLTPIQEGSRQRLLGWCCYYLGLKNKGPSPREKMGNEAREAFVKTLQVGKTQEDIDSALNGLPLVYYFLLSEPEKAVQVTRKAMQKAQSRARILNVEGIIKREEGFLGDALDRFTQAYEAAQKEKDFRTCGHSLNNKARTLLRLLPNLRFKQDVWREAKELFEQSLVEYRKFEKETGESADFHIQGVEKYLEDYKKKTAIGDEQR